MKITFGIVTGGTNNPNEQHVSINTITNRIHHIINSIELQQIPHNSYEIIIVGGPNVYTNREKVIHIPFDHIKYSQQIGRQKNLITKRATYDIITYQHDYLVYEPNWYQGFINFGNDWDVSMNIINNKYTGRWMDWITRDDPNLQMFGDHSFNVVYGSAMVPYDYTSTKYMYISGTYWVAKKDFMLKYPISETLKWGESEDVLWSQSWRLYAKYKMNINSSVKIVKDGKFYGLKFLLKEDAIQCFNTEDIAQITKFCKQGALAHTGLPWITTRDIYYGNSIKS